MNHQTFLAQKKRWQKPVEIGWEKRVWGKGGVGEVGGVRPCQLLKLYLLPFPVIFLLYFIDSDSTLVDHVNSF